jgi:hypothetical protein
LGGDVRRMAVHVLQFRQRLPGASDWSQQEIAEFYRVESALVQAGLRLVSDRGLTDEGDPWFVFCRQDTGEVFIHFARFDGEYVIDGAAYETVVRSRDFKALVRELISNDLVALARPRPKGNNVFIHPAALLIALVGAAFFHSGKADAAEASDHRSGARRLGGALNLFGSSASEKLPMGLDAAQTATVMAGVIIGLDQQRALPLPIILALSSEAPAQAYDLALTQGVMNLDAAATKAAAVDAQADPTLADVQTARAMMLTAMSLHAAQGLSIPTDASDQAGISVITPTPVVISLVSAPDLGFLPTNADKPFLLAQLVSTLPNDEAAAVVQAASNGDLKILSLAAKLPTMISDLIGRGEHVTAAPPPAETGMPPADATTTAPGADASAPGVNAPGSQPSAPVGGGVTTPAISSGHSPADPTAAIPSPTTAAPGPSLHPHDPAIDAAVAAFMGEAAHWEVVVSGRDLVIYDTQIFGPLPANTPLDSLTFTFSDGTSLSLVGTTQEIANLYHIH